MKTLPTTLLVLSISMATLMTTTLYAAEKEHEHKGASSSEPSEGNAHMQKMHDHMKTMQTEMQVIHAEKDPEKKKQLMQAHKKSMHEGMQMMKKDMDGNGMMGMMKEGKKMDPNARMDHMEKRMSMMQQMMDQMMQHQEARISSTEEYLKKGTP